MPHHLRDVLRLLAVVFAVLVFVSCSDNEPPDAGSAIGVTDAQDEDASEDESDVAGADAGEDFVLDLTFTKENGDIEPFTGRPLGDEALLSKRAIVAKIDNDEKAWPQDGLDEADIVYEIAIENQLTRFLAVFHSTAPEVVGPVRSARSSDIDLLAPLGNPLFAYSGSNDIVGQEVRGGENAGLLVRASFDDITAAYEDVGDRPRPHQRMLFPERVIEDRLTTAEATVQPVFRYNAEGESTEGAPNPGMRFTTNQRTPVTYAWDDDMGVWKRYQGLVPHLAGSGDQIAPANVVALEIDYKISAADAASPQAITSGTGRAVVFTEGGRVEGVWRRDNPRNGFDILDLGGDPVRLAAGQTFVQLMREGDMALLDQDQADAAADPASVNE